METISGLDSLINMSVFSGFLKILFIALQFVYIFYAFMITRQVKIMNRSFNTPAEPLFTSLAFFHFIGSIVIATMTILFS